LKSEDPGQKKDPSHHIPYSQFLGALSLFSHLVISPLTFFFNFILSFILSLRKGQKDLSLSCFNFADLSNIKVCVRQFLFHVSPLTNGLERKPAMPLVPSSAPLPGSMTTFAYLREQKILNIVYVGLLVVEVLMVLGVISVALVKRVKAHRRPKSIRPVTPSTSYAPHQYMHIENEKSTL
jgi:hypothetical protein